uniref:Uncharacterized protein n=1 Tax=Arundo donax TaxID=35708 RepID=A0A0A9U9I7_ARUDO
MLFLLGEGSLLLSRASRRDAGAVVLYNTPAACLQDTTETHQMCSCCTLPPSKSIQNLLPLPWYDG